MRLATVDRSTAPATIVLPREYNAATEFIDANLAKGRAGKTAFIDAGGSYTYGELVERVNRAGNALRALGAGMETRVLMCMLDDIDFPAVFWGAIKAGCVPVPINTLLTSDDYAHLLRDSRARIVVVSEALLDRFAPALADQPHVEQVVIAGDDEHGGTPTPARPDSGVLPAATVRPDSADRPGPSTGIAGPDRHRLSDLLADASPHLDPAPTTCDDVAFWLYTSGSTGTPKGSMHLHRDLVVTAVHYGVGTLGIREDDVVYSAAKLFFAYGLGNGMTFPVLRRRDGGGPRRPSDAGRGDGGPARASADHLLRRADALRRDARAAVRRPPETVRRGCVSRSRPARRCRRRVGAAWEERFGAPILDGLGSTEMLHIFLSNRRGDVRFGPSGIAGAGGTGSSWSPRTGEPAAPGEIGELWVSGGSSAVAYWNQREKSLDTFHGPWTRTGDKYVVDEEGRYHYCGRTDDMLKVGGTVGIAVRGGVHAARARSGARGRRRRRRRRAGPWSSRRSFVVPREGVETDAALAAALQEFVKDRLAPFKYPRWIEFAGDLPKTATGKIQRFKLRQ